MKNLEPVRVSLATRYVHGDDGCDGVQVGDEHADLGDAGGEQQRPARLALPGAVAERVQHRDQVIAADGLQQARRPAVATEATETIKQRQTTPQR